ncbi:hypothetical protein P154DRAFT_529336 [Amniculicola lignicola CBS 123094]|uniref:Uncharacterized protein n=1 Tax=Amniculicola lignicola CBS 123094 TaxID=1392246 RepID=A0A6A5X0B3_9PLEO|nr:hypothetical protein P154DRAFT_529336 [Amniculicola lignicola CBS 123094]
MTYEYTPQSQGYVYSQSTAPAAYGTSYSTTSQAGQYPSAYSSQAPSPYGQNAYSAPALSRVTERYGLWCIVRQRLSLTGQSGIPEPAAYELIIKIRKHECQRGNYGPRSASFPKVFKLGEIEDKYLTDGPIDEKHAVAYNMVEDIALSVPAPAASLTPAESDLRIYTWKSTYHCVHRLIIS